MVAPGEMRKEYEVYLMMSSWIKKEKFRLALCFIAGVGLFFRAWGMWFGLPLLLHPDESVFVEKAMRFGTGNLNPQWFGHPGNNLMYILFFEFIGYYLFGSLFNWFDSVEVFKNHFFADPTVFYILGRSVGVLSGTLSVIAIGYLGKRLVNERVGIISALFLSLSPLSIENSKYIRTDIIGTLFVIIAIHYGLKYWDSRCRKYFVITSVGIGMAAASKYPLAIAGVTVLLLMDFLRMESSERFFPKYTQKNYHIKFFLISCLIIVITFFAVTPFFFFDFKTAYKDIVVELGGTHLGAKSLPLPRTFWWYIHDVLQKDFGLPILIGAGLGIFLSIRNCEKRNILVLAFPMFYFIFICSARLKWDRWVIPVIPFVGLYSAIALDRFIYILNLRFQDILEKRKYFVSIRHAILAIILLSFVFYPLKESIAIDKELSLPDTRQICLDWIKQNIPEGKFAQDWYTFQPSHRYAYYIGEFQVENYEILQEFSIANKTLKDYREKRCTHVIISSYLYDRYFREAVSYPKEVQFYRSLFARVPLKTFEFIDNKVTGPNISIYTID